MYDSELDDQSCIICQDHVKKPSEYFECWKSFILSADAKESVKEIDKNESLYKFHIICNKCFIRQSLIKNICSICKAKLCKEHKNPQSLEVDELCTLDKRKIPQRNIYVYQNFELPPHAKIMTVDFDNSSGKSIIMKLYSLGGKFMEYKSMLVGEDGFLYSYNTQYERYHIAIQKGRYQFWDASRISLDLS